MTEGSGDHFQQPSTGRENISHRSFHEPGREQRFSWTPQKITGWLRRRISENNWRRLLQRPEPPIDPVRLLARAKRGVEAFKQSYEAGDGVWKQFLTETEDGEDIQAMYLGLKPALFIEEEPHVEVIGRNRDQRLNMVTPYFMHDPELVVAMIARHPDLFPDYAAKKQSIDEYIQRLEAAPLNAWKKVQLGILFGYPRNAVLQWVKYTTIRSFFGTSTLTYGEPVTPEEQEIRSGYWRGYIDVPVPTHKDFQMNVNRFRDEHEDEIQSVIEKVFPGTSIPQEAKTYLLTNRYIWLPGLNYASGNPKASDDAFAQRVRDIFTASGMNAFIASVHGTTVLSIRKAEERSEGRQEKRGESSSIK